MQIYAVITSTKLVMKLKLVTLESGSSPLSNDAISVSIRCIVWKIFAFKTTPLKIDTFRPDENELSTQLGSLSVNVQIVLILLAKNKSDTKIFSLCVCELDLSAEGKDGNFISCHLLLLTQRRGWLMNNCSEQFPFYQRS
jgi:hypothetical protein